VPPNKPLKGISPSQIKTFHGCGRRWWYEKRKSLVEAESASTRLGTVLHALVEAHVLMLSGPKRAEHIRNSTRPKRQSDPFIPPSTNEILQAEGLFAHGLKNGLVPPPIGPDAPVEQQFQFPYPGLGESGINGRIDFKDPAARLIVDYKTTSDPRYAETEESLPTNDQAVCYAKALLDEVGGEDPITVEFRYFRTKKLQESWVVRIEMSPAEIKAKWETLILSVVDQMLAYYNQDDPESVPCEASNCNAFGRKCPAFDVCSKNNRKAVAARSLRPQTSAEVQAPMSATVDSLITAQTGSPTTQNVLAGDAMGKIAIKLALQENPTDNVSAGKVLDILIPKYLLPTGRFNSAKAGNFNQTKEAFNADFGAELAKLKAAKDKVDGFATGLKAVAQVALDEDQQALADALVSLGYPEDVSSQLVLNDVEQATLILESGTPFAPETHLGDEEETDAPPEVVAPTPPGKTKAAPVTKTAVPTPPTVRPEPVKQSKSSAPDFGHDALNARWSNLEEGLMAAFLKGVSDTEVDMPAFGALFDTLQTEGSMARAPLEASLKAIFHRDRWKSGAFADSILSLLGVTAVYPTGSRQPNAYAVATNGAVVAPLVKPVVSRAAPPVTHEAEAPAPVAAAPKVEAPAPKATTPVVVAPKVEPPKVEAPKVEALSDAADNVFAELPLHGAILCIGVRPPVNNPTVDLAKVIYDLEKTALEESGKSLLGQSFNDGFKKVIGPKIVEMAESGAFAGAHVVVDPRLDSWRLVGDHVLGAWLHYGALVYQAFGA
jgi:hypothetical protein